MKIFLLLFLYFSDSFAGFLIDNTFCAYKLDTDYSNAIVVSGYDGNYLVPTTKTFWKASIISFKSGYNCNSGFKADWVKNQQIFKNSYDLTTEIKAEIALSSDSEFMTILKNSGNIVENLYLVDSGSTPSNTTHTRLSCTDGTSLRNSAGNAYNYYSPSGQIINSTSPSNFTAHTNAKFNLDTNECYIEQNAPFIDVSSTFKAFDSFTYHNDFFNNNARVTPKIRDLTTLIKSSTDLPTQNSLENKFDIDTTSSGLNCKNSLYSLQEKLLCEMNAGIRKLNQEANPRYSLNNLISILITSTDKNSEETNKSIKAISSFEEVRLQKQKDTNTLLDSTVTNQNQINTSLSQIETTLKGIETNTNGGIVSGPTHTIVTPGETPPTVEPLNLDKYLKPDETVNNDDLNNINNDTDSLINTLFSSFTDFKTNITDSVDSINNQLDGLKETIENPTNIFSKVKIINCPVTYQADFSAFGIGKKVLILDYCEFTSRLQPIVYFFTYVSLFLGLIFFSFRFIGVLI